MIDVLIFSLEREQQTNDFPKYYRCCIVYDAALAANSVMTAVQKKSKIIVLFSNAVTSINKGMNFHG